MESIEFDVPVQKETTPTVDHTPIRRQRRRRRAAPVAKAAAKGSRPGWQLAIMWGSVLVLAGLWLAMIIGQSLWFAEDKLDQPAFGFDRNAVVEK